MDTPMHHKDFVSCFYYLELDEALLFTAVLLPEEAGLFPAVIVRTPYVNELSALDEKAVADMHYAEYGSLVKNKYAVVIQHCRGCGKSSGNFIPHSNEREDGLHLQSWVRSKNFYNGEIFLLGSSYLSSAHYATAPFAPDIKGAVLGYQDCDNYNICYRNGFFKKALYGAWYAGVYCQKTLPERNCTPETFDILPFSEFSRTVFGMPEPSFDDILYHPYREEDYWGPKNIVHDAGIPILFTTGFYDIYTGGVFQMWDTLDSDMREISALLVSPYGHGDDPGEVPLFPNAKLSERFGDYVTAWFNHIRFDTALPFGTGNITYYRMFDERWQCEPALRTERRMTLPMGAQKVSYVYDPANAPEFPGGLSTNFGGAKFQPPPNFRDDVKSIYTQPFSADVFVKGRMEAQLCVRSNQEDTCFLIRISLSSDDGDFGLRDDIVSLCMQLGNYCPGSKAILSFCFDEHAFRIQKGQRLRIDIASADNLHYVRHINQKGLFSKQVSAVPAYNEVFLEDSFLTLPVES